MGEYDDEEPPAGMSETEQALWKKRKAQQAADEEELEEFLAQREEERERLERELEELKERQARRREEREEEEAQMAEMRRMQEEQRKIDEEERKAKAEAEKRKKEAERKKKQAMMAGGGMGGLMGMASGDGKPNFVLPHKEGGGEEKPAGPKADPKASKEDVAAAKAAYMARFQEPFAGEDMDASELRMRIKGMHEEITKLEAAKYDMEQRIKIQDYDLKELRERAKQQARQKAIKKGLDPDEYANAKHPPKKAVASKYDRQIDRRSYGERKVMFAKCLRIDGRPAVPPPKKIFHGSCRPPVDFGRPAAKIEELEVLRKNMEPPKYQELAPVEGAKPPVAPVKAGEVPEDEPEPVTKAAVVDDEPAPPPPRAADPEPEPEPETEPEAEEEEEEEEEE